jgi:hypothetical protein
LVLEGNGSEGVSTKVRKKGGDAQVLRAATKLGFITMPCKTGISEVQICKESRGGDGDGDGEAGVTALLSWERRGGERRVSEIIKKLRRRKGWHHTITV